MAKAVKRQSQPRSYVSAKRDEQAKATRWAILTAARSLFVERGYAATTIQAVADEAGVAVQTVYAAFGNKREILKQVLDVSVAGDDEPLRLSERSSIQAVRDEPDRRRRAEMGAAIVRGIAERTAAVAKVIRDAAAADPEMADLWAIMQADRREGMRNAAQNLAGPEGKLRDDLKSAADTLFVLYSMDVALLLTDDLGWSLDKYEAWLADMLERTLLK